MIDILLIILLLGIAAAVTFYLVREKKRGVTCVGCPHAKQCAKAHGASCGDKKTGTCSCGNTK